MRIKMRIGQISDPPNPSNAPNPLSPPSPSHPPNLHFKNSLF